MSQNEQRLFSCLGLLFAAIACMAALIVIPEVRCYIGLQTCTSSETANLTPGAATPTAPGSINIATSAAPTTAPGSSAVSINLGLFLCQSGGPTGWCWTNSNAKALLNMLYTADGGQLAITVLDNQVHVIVNGNLASLAKTGRGKTMQSIITSAAPWDVQLSKDLAKEHYLVTFQATP